LVRACEEGTNNAPDEPMTNKTIKLSEKEILSNLFPYDFAGNDTTAVTLTNLLVHLAANPETQEWIAEELNYYIPTGDSNGWNFQVFPDLSVAKQSSYAHDVRHVRSC
jgi:cytochrome P450